MSKSLHLSFIALLLSVLSCVNSVQAQCTEPNSNTIFLFIPGHDTLFVDNNCFSILDYGTPYIEPSFAGQIIDSIASGIDLGLTTDLENAPLTTGNQVTVFYIGVEGAPDFRRDTFCYTIDIVDNIRPTFMEFPENDTVCITDIPMPNSIDVLDNCTANLTIEITDDTLDSDGFCNGGMIRRIWEATDPSGNSSMMSQLIIVEAPSTDINIDYTPIPGLGYCGGDNYLTWATAVKDTIEQKLAGYCGIAQVVRGAPFDFTDCGTLLVDFTIEDICGNSTLIQAPYTNIDTIAPTFVVAPVDRIASVCSLAELDTSMVVLSDNCDDVDNLLLSFSDALTPIGDACGEVMINRTWTATDACGNSTVLVNTIIVRDTIAPDFDVPSDLVLNCGEIIEPSSTGTPSNFSDNCSGDNVTITSSDTIVGLGGFVEVQRHWVAEDRCGNQKVKIQRIQLFDTIGPTFDLRFTELDIACSDLYNFAVTGEPRMLFEQCSSDDVDVTYSDSASSGNCSGNGAIIRTWRATDAAGNFNEATQEIRIEDNLPPDFINEAMDEVFSCADTMAVLDAFQAWVDARGNARASDDCTADSILTWTAFNAGTMDLPSLGLPSCGDSLSIYRIQAVDFIVTDLCGNTAMTTAAFSIADNTAPDFAFCPQDTTLQAVSGSCSASFMLIPPRVVEECGAEEGIFNRTITVPISSDQPGNKDVPVNRVQLSFAYTPSQDFPTGNVSLSLSLFNIDADNPTEYFKVFLEDGTEIGRTATTPRCGSSISPIVFTNITAEQMIEAAGSNNRITFFLEPYIAPGLPSEVAISDICGNSSVVATLRFETATPSGATYWYSINDGLRILYLPEAPIVVRFNAGINTVAYYVTDCAGNLASCSYQVNVSDTEAPGITCPSDIVLQYDSTGCTASYPLPLPDIVTDNCIFGNTSSLTLPIDSLDALLSFTASPDLGDFLADDVILTFDDIDRNTLNDVSLKISLRGDIDNTLGYFEVFGEDDTSLGTTRLGQLNVTAGDCTRFSETFINIPANTYNTWAADGELTITAKSNTDISIPPGGPGDGLNPCDHTLVNITGDRDTTSMLFATLTYNEVQYSYFTEGATTTPLVVVADSIVQPIVDFNIGTTEVFYIIEDSNMNSDTCSFMVTVEDNEPPVANCVEATTITINPAGATSDTIQLSEINLNSTDNCSIDSMFIFPNILNCAAASEEFLDITLTVIDGFGNESTCVTPVRIVTEAPQPSSFITPCIGDSLYLSANPPAAPTGVAYTYLWTGPSGFTSTVPNPIIPNPEEDNEGSYTVTITGTTGCTAVGTMEVSISEEMNRPSISGPAQFCLGQEFQLETSFDLPTGTMYRWYAGTPSNRMLVGTTTTPALVIIPTIAGVQTYFLETQFSNCTSNPSIEISVDIIDVPAAVIDLGNAEPCEGERIELSTSVTGLDLEYEWTGPNGFSSNLQNPLVLTDISSLDSGTYYLTIRQGVCTSDRVSTEVSVKAKPARPILSGNTVVCEGEAINLMINDSLASSYHWLRPNNNSEQVRFENEFSIENAELIHAGQWRSYITRNGCTSDLSEGLTIVVNDIPELSISANQTQLCEGGSLQLQASPMLLGATYRWEGPNGLNASTQNPTFSNLTVDNQGTFFCTLTTAEGCSVTQSLMIEVDTGITIDTLQNTGTECVSGPTNIRLRALITPPDDGTYQYLWTGPDNFSSRDSIATIPTATETQNGNYTLVVTNASGCASDAESMLIDIREAPDTPATPSFGDSTQPPFCEGGILNIGTTGYSGTQVEYHWLTPDSIRVTNIPTFVNNELNANNSGEYALYVIVDGCRSLQSGVLQVEVGSQPEISVTTNSPVCEGEQLSLEATLVSGATYSWMGPSGITASGFNPVFSSAQEDIHKGVYTVQAELNGCLSESIFTDVTVTALPRRPTGAAAPPIVCVDAPDEALRLAVAATTATLGADYIWYDQDLNPLATLSDGALVFNVPNLGSYTQGTYQFYVQAVKDSCFSELSAPVEVTFSQVPALIAYAGEDISSCGDSILMLDALPPSVGEGVWTQVGGDSSRTRIIDPSAANTIITGLEDNNSYQFAWTISNASCIGYSTDTISLNINSISSASAGSDTVYCSLSSFQLHADELISGMGTWTQSEAQAIFATIGDRSDPNTTVFISSNAAQDYYFTWSVTGAACGDSEDIVRVTVSGGIPIPGPDFDACGDGCVDLNAVEPPTQIGRWYSPDIGILFNDPSNASTIACGLQAGQNMFVWEIDNGACGDASRDTLYVDYEFVATLADDDVFTLFGQAVTIDAAENDFFPMTSYTISILNNPLNGTVEDLGNGQFFYRPNADFVGTDVFTYEVCSPSCEDCASATVRIVVDENLECTIPNVFTPNGDGVNDLFVIPCLTTSGFPGNVLTIFNQWGDEVYRKENYDNSWDGTFDGEPLPTAYYFFMMDFNNGELPTTGYVLLQR